MCSSWPQNITAFLSCALPVFFWDHSIPISYNFGLRLSYIVTIRFLCSFWMFRVIRTFRKVTCRFSRTGDREGLWSRLTLFLCGCNCVRLFHLNQSQALAYRNSVSFPICSLISLIFATRWKSASCLISLFLCLPGVSSILQFWSFYSWNLKISPDLEYMCCSVDRV